MANTVKVTLIKSVSGRIPNHKLCVRAWACVALVTP